MTAFTTALDGLTRVPGLRAALVVSSEDGLVVGEVAMGTVDAAAVAALATNLARRCGDMAGAAGRRAPGLAHLEASHGSLLMVPAGPELALVVVAEPAVNVGLLRLAMQAAAEQLA